MQRVRHANRGRLLLRTPGPVPLWDLHVFNLSRNILIVFQNVPITCCISINWKTFYKGCVDFGPYYRI